jgi:hypothetical protein
MHQFIISRGPNLNCRLPLRARPTCCAIRSLHCGDASAPTMSFVRMINNSGEDNFVSIQGERAAAPPLNGSEWMRASKIVICRVLSKIIITEWRMYATGGVSAKVFSSWLHKSALSPAAPRNIHHSAVRRRPRCSNLAGVCVCVCWESKLIKAQWRTYWIGHWVCVRCCGD